MCNYTTIIFPSCGCRCVLKSVCLAHITHTARQVDDDPCVDLREVLYKAPQGTICWSDKHGHGKLKVLWEFEGGWNHRGEGWCSRERRAGRVWDDDYELNHEDGSGFYTMKHFIKKARMDEQAMKNEKSGGSAYEVMKGRKSVFKKA